MSATYEHTIEVGVSTERVFALLDDLPRTPEWLAPCTALEKRVPGPNAVGDQLKYSYKQGGQSGIMDGEILARTVNSNLTCRYWDSKFEVRVEFKMSSSGVGTRLTHIITMTPRGFMTQLMLPLIRLGLPKQTREAMESLKSILEGAPAGV